MSSHSVMNVAAPEPATVFDIFPTNNEAPIKLMGWLRAYADYPISCEFNHRAERGDFEQRKVTYSDILQEIYEVQGTGEWLGVETWTNRNIANLAHYTCRVKLTKNKSDLIYFFRSPDYVRPLLAAIGLEYATHLGNPHKEA